ncbi:flagellar basal body-associated FliL family protein [Marinagarivorans algicola]|uniref:flagellar basal body-associated FliL family protein n=1 Tax=Marinagarivorans algicola TaxID=1513270 RepID=UPI0006B8BCA2|nr:flagellar basal body-associated FliL family protein [Marinagarivorans algicola]
MAEDDAPVEEGSGGGKKKLIFLIILAVVLVGLSVGGTIVALKVLSPPPEAVDSEAVEEAVEEVKAPAIYYPIKPSVVVNYDHKGRQRYAQVDVTLLIRDPAIVSAIELHAPTIANALVLTIGGQNYEEVQTAEGKELLRQECLQEIQKILEEEVGSVGVEQVLFTNFVMQ